jgi:long-chain fatty acid transport protein
MTKSLILFLLFHTIGCFLITKKENKMKKYKKVLAALLAVCAFSSTAKAGGYQLNDYSVTGLGRAYAGAGVVGDDYSAIAFNPAGMTLVKKSGIQTGLTMVNLKADVDSLDGVHHKKMDFWTPIPQFFGQYNVNDNLAVGFGLYAPFGLKTQYDANWFGSDTAILSKLDVIDTNLSVAYKLNKQWSVGASLIARYIYGHMTNSTSALGGGTSDFELDGWTRTGALGVMYEPQENTRFGFSWRLRSTQQVKGDHEISGTAASGGLFNQVATGWASPALPETFTLSAYHKYKAVGISGTARWTHWSQSFPEFTMKSDSRLFNYLYAGNPMGTDTYGKTSVYNYDNTWTLTAGLDWYYNENWTFRCGTGWDESPTHNDTSRTIRIPDNDRFWASVGASYMTENWQIDAAYTRMFARAGKALETSDPSSTLVKYKNMTSNLVGVQVQYKF